MLSIKDIRLEACEVVGTDKIVLLMETAYADKYKLSYNNLEDKGISIGLGANINEEYKRNRLSFKRIQYMMDNVLKSNIAEYSDMPLYVDNIPSALSPIRFTLIDDIIDKGYVPVEVIEVNGKLRYINVSDDSTALKSFASWNSMLAETLLRKRNVKMKQMFGVVDIPVNKVVNRLTRIHWDNEITKFSRIYKDAIDNNHLIIYYVDSDADGVLSGAVCNLFNVAIMPYKNYVVISNDRVYGNGINEHTITMIRDILVERNLPDDTKFLMITADHGSSNGQMVPMLKDNFNNIKIAVTDHHNFGAGTEAFDAHINNQDDASSIPEGMSGAGVIALTLMKTYMTIKRSYGIPGLFHPLLQYVAVSLVSDRRDMLCPYNRAVVKLFENEVHVRALPSLATLSNFSYDWGWTLIPEINSAGRMSQSKVALDYLMALTPEEVSKRRRPMRKLNKRRKQVTAILKEHTFTSETMAELDKYKRMAFFVIKYSSLDSLGVTLAEVGGNVGILAGTAKSFINRPIIVFSENEDGDFAGSGRKNVVGNFTFRELLRRARKVDGMILKGGGHDGAAGMVVAKDKFEEFKRLADDYAISADGSYPKVYNYDIEMDFKFIGKQLFELQRRLGPYGTNFDMPVIKVTGLSHDIVKHEVFSHGAKTIIHQTETESPVAIVKWGGVSNLTMDELYGTLGIDSYSGGYSLTFPS